MRATGRSCYLITGSSVHHDDHGEVTNVSRSTTTTAPWTPWTSSGRTYCMATCWSMYNMRLGLWDQRDEPVLTRFDYGLAINDSLLTLCQLMSARYEKKYLKQNNLRFSVFSVSSLEAEFGHDPVQHRKLKASTYIFIAIFAFYN